MSRPRVYPARASLHLKVSHDVLQALTKYKLENGISLNRAVDEVLRIALDVKADPLATTIERIEKVKKPRKKKDALSPAQETNINEDTKATTKLKLKVSKS